MKKIFSIVLAMVMMLSLCACGDTAKSGSGVESKDTVVAVFNGKEITRGDVGDDLIMAEQDAIMNYVYSQVVKEFFKDVEVTDSEADLQMELMKAQVGEEQWPIYLAMYGGGTEESFREMLIDSLRQEKYISEKGESVEITDEKLASLYDANPDYYNIAVLDVVFMGDVNALAEAKKLYGEGKSLEEIAEALGSEVSSNEHTYFDSDGLTWEKNFNDCSVGDIVFSGEDSGSLVIGRVKELNIGISNPTVRQDMIDMLKYEEAYNQTNEEYIEFLKTKTVTIFGEEFPLYEEEATDVSDTATDDTIVIDGTANSEDTENHDHDGDGVADH